MMHTINRCIGSRATINTLNGLMHQEHVKTGGLEQGEFVTNEKPGL
jgi:hypothetical protein